MGFLSDDAFRRENASLTDFVAKISLGLDVAKVHESGYIKQQDLPIISSKCTLKETIRSGGIYDGVYLASHHRRIEK